MDIVINAETVLIPENTTPISTQGNFYHNLLVCLGYSDAAPPVADLLSRYHHLDGDWVIVSPVHWQATHNDAMIVASGSQLQLSEQESLLWFQKMKEFVASENMQLHYHDAQTWLLEHHGKSPINAKPVHTIQHQSLMPELKKLDKTLFWQRFITETQMFFSAHPLNNERTGLVPINGVWFWGSGLLTEKVNTQLICHDAEMRNLADLLSTNVSDSQMLKTAVNNSVHLFTELNQQSLDMLQTQLQKNTVRWYWNNLAFQSKPKSWIARLMASKSC